MELLQGVEAVRNDGRRMMAGITWTMEVMPKIGGKLDSERLANFMKRARVHHGTAFAIYPRAGRRMVFLLFLQDRRLV